MHADWKNIGAGLYDLNVEAYTYSWIASTDQYMIRDRWRSDGVWSCKHTNERSIYSTNITDRSLTQIRMAFTHKGITKPPASCTIHLCMLDTGKQHTIYIYIYIYIAYIYIYLIVYSPNFTSSSSPYLSANARQRILALVLVNNQIDFFQVLVYLRPISYLASVDFTAWIRGSPHWFKYSRLDGRLEELLSCLLKGGRKWKL